MQDTDNKNINAKYGYWAIATFYVYLLIIYPLVYYIAPVNLDSSNTNRFFLALLIFIMIIVIGNRLSSPKQSKIDTLNIFAMYFMLCSLILYTIISGMSISDFFREILYSILPIQFYFLAKKFTKSEVNFFYRILLLSMIFVISTGALTLLGIQIPYGIIIKKDYTISSFYGPILMGYIAQLLFALVLFEVIKVGILRSTLLIIFFITSILTLQRAPYFGVSFAILFYFIFHGKKNLFGITVIVITLLTTFYIFTNIDMSGVFGFDQRVSISDEFKNIQLERLSDDRDRKDQSLIYNDNNILNILLGEGYGKYSPNNFQTIHKMPDANYYRIYNELGIIGGIIFFMPFLAIFLKALSRKDPFMLFLITYTLFAFYFNRVLWAVPTAYVIYTIIGISESKEYGRPNI